VDVGYRFGNFLLAASWRLAAAPNLLRRKQLWQCLTKPQGAGGEPWRCDAIAKMAGRTDLPS
jgi:hypothetical protein